MRGRRLWPLLAALMMAVMLAGAPVMAAEQAGEGEGEKAEKKAEKDEGEKQQAEKGEEEKLTLEDRLVMMQEALNKWVEERGALLPRQIRQLTSFLPEDKRGKVIEPKGEKEIVMNEGMAGCHDFTIEKPAEFITFYAASDSGEKGRAVVFGDKNVKYLKKEEFEKTLKASKARRLSREQISVLIQQARDRRRQQRARQNSE